MMIVSGLLFALLLGGFIFLMLPRASAFQRAASAVLFVVLVAMVYGGSIEMLSLPKPLRLEWREPSKAKVLGASLDEGKAIYVWLQVGNSHEPRAYALPWNMKLAQQLQNAMRKGQKRGTGVEVSHPFASVAAGSGSPGRPQFYAKPQPANPPKHYARESDLVAPGVPPAR